MFLCAIIGLLSYRLRPWAEMTILRFPLQVEWAESTVAEFNCDSEVGQTICLRGPNQWVPDGSAHDGFGHGRGPNPSWDEPSRTHSRDIILIYSD